MPEDMQRMLGDGDGGNKQHDGTEHGGTEHDGQLDDAGANLVGKHHRVCVHDGHDNYRAQNHDHNHDHYHDHNYGHGHD